MSRHRSRTVTPEGSRPERRQPAAVDPALSSSDTEAGRSRWAFLAEASRCLADTLEYEQTLETVAALALPLLGSWSIVDLSQPDGSVRRLAIVHPEKEMQEVARALKQGWPPLRDDPFGVSVVALTGEPDLVTDITDELLVRVARNEENLERLRALGMRSLITVPMIARGRTLGAITFISSGESRTFTESDLSLAEDLAHRCGTAIDNARLHSAAQALVTTDRARLQAEAADQVKSEFLATVSHELRTPLNVMAGYLELLAMEIAGPLNATQSTYIERVRTGERQLLRIVEDMLNFVRLHSNAIEYDLRDVRLRATVADIATVYRDGLEEKGLVLEVECDPDVTAHADPAKVWQILMNLVSNARKFTEPGGRVMLRCAAGDATGPVKIEVIDTGCGIPPERIDAIFAPFVQADGSLTRPAEGMGLGLAISRHLARDMGGDLVVDQSGPEGGCTFTLTLPRATDSRRSN